MSKRADSGVTGAVVVDKPAGMTSHDVVARLRRLLGTRKVGHAGTLDPDATGVLVVGVGRATKLLSFVTGSDKSYIGEIRFGAATSTLDSAGEITERFDMDFSFDEVAAAAAGLTGDIEQIPPMVSAVRIGGKRLHELARQGIEVDRPPRPVTVHRFDVTPTDDPLVYQCAVDCSSGTYIRVLAADVGAALGGGAHLHGLRRTAVGPFGLDAASPLDEPVLRPALDLVADLPQRQLTDDEATAVSYGRPLEVAQGPDGLDVALVGPDGELWAVYRSDGRRLKPSVVLRAS